MGKEGVAQAVKGTENYLCPGGGEHVAVSENSLAYDCRWVDLWRHLSFHSRQALKAKPSWYSRLEDTKPGPLNVASFCTLGAIGAIGVCVGGGPPSARMLAHQVAKIGVSLESDRTGLTGPMNCKANRGSR